MDAGASKESLAGSIDLCGKSGIVSGGEFRVQAADGSDGAGGDVSLSGGCGAAIEGGSLLVAAAQSGSLCLCTGGGPDTGLIAIRTPESPSGPGGACGILSGGGTARGGRVDVRAGDSGHTSRHGGGGHICGSDSLVGGKLHVCGGTGHIAEGGEVRLSSGSSSLGGKGGDSVLKSSSGRSGHVGMTTGHARDSGCLAMLSGKALDNGASSRVALNIGNQSRGAGGSMTMASGTDDAQCAGGSVYLCSRCSYKAKKRRWFCWDRVLGSALRSGIVSLRFRTIALGRYCIFW